MQPEQSQQPVRSLLQPVILENFNAHVELTPLHTFRINAIKCAKNSGRYPQLPSGRMEHPNT